MVRVRIEGHSMNPWSDRELTVTVPDKQYEQLEAGLAVGTLKVEGVDAKRLSAAAAAGEAEVSDVQAGQLELSSAAGKVILRDTWAQKVEVGAAAGSLQLEGVEADELSVGSAVGGASLKQVTAGDLEIASALGSLKLEDVWADTYTKAGLILHPAARSRSDKDSRTPHPPQGAGSFAACTYDSPPIGRARGLLALQLAVEKEDGGQLHQVAEAEVDHVTRCRCGSG